MFRSENQGQRYKDRPIPRGTEKEYGRKAILQLTPSTYMG